MTELCSMSTLAVPELVDLRKSGSSTSEAGVDCPEEATLDVALSDFVYVEELELDGMRDRENKDS
jgi:hypothetical protein